MLYLTNAFSIHMLPEMECHSWENIRFKRIGSNEARDMLAGKKFYSFFGHVDTVKHLENRWRMKIHVSREMMTFRKGDQIIVATVSAKREWEQQKDRHPNFRFYLVEYV